MESLGWGGTLPLTCCTTCCFNRHATCCHNKQWTARGQLLLLRLHLYRSVANPTIIRLERCTKSVSTFHTRILTVCCRVIDCIGYKRQTPRGAASQSDRFDSYTRVDKLHSWREDSWSILSFTSCTYHMITSRSKSSQPTGSYIESFARAPWEMARYLP